MTSTLEGIQHNTLIFTDVSVCRVWRDVLHVLVVLVNEDTDIVKTTVECMYAVQKHNIVKSLGC